MSLKNNAIYIIMLVVLIFFAYMDYRYLDIQFLPATSGDEFPQFYQLFNMYEGLKQFNIEKFFRFEFYNYGFGWYLLNLLAVIPFHILHSESMAIFAPRVLNGLFSVMCLWMVYKISCLYLRRLYAYGIVLLFLSMPGFYLEGYIFKPDVLQAFFLLWCVFLFMLDDFRFGKNYYLAIGVFGLGVGVAKFQAVMFFPMVYAYILLPFFVDKKAFPFKKVFYHGIFSSAMILFIWILSNPYLLHPRGFRAWWEMFIINMHSNATNHGNNIHVSLGDKIFGIIDIYYLEIFVFVILCLVFLGLLGKFLYLRSKHCSYRISHTDIFIVIGVGVFVSLAYLLFGVNKAWSNYYISTFYLGILLFIPILMVSKIRHWTLLILLILQICGGGGAKWRL
ncbi:glycosyltransferase family 39 protein [Helicobacter sp. 11S03491-1]|uniref:ArnT family glycosyltransferase n=1 Tax=Helicobacter sp. 11S03491-1 TaxID=1476196 RepID=UPI000BA62957|nr:glycosyltransferase family 39 protein [Helicobacter sp. 11S03491-1]PAF43456.1 hypothetical protein BKH45_02180 [Helicobacter sp. 11S03491-1]